MRLPLESWSDPRGGKRAWTYALRECSEKQLRQILIGTRSVHRPVADELSEIDIREDSDEQSAVQACHPGLGQHTPTSLYQEPLSDLKLLLPFRSPDQRAAELSLTTREQEPVDPKARASMQTTR